MIFDLWDTLVDWPADVWARLRLEMARLVQTDEARFDELWRETYWIRQTGPIRDAVVALGGPEEADEQVLEARTRFTRAALVPRRGALETLHELRRRGYRLGLISVCSEEVAQVWEMTPFAGLFDSTVFSATCALRKPDREIYELALRELDVEPHEAVFVGDGANDELAGAERVGMRAVLVHRPGEEPRWEEARAFSGRRITEISQLLALIEDHGHSTEEGRC